jgi:hypothetical protein
MKLLHTEVLCTGDKEEKYGMKEEPIWLRVTIDLDSVVGVKECAPEDEDIPYPDRCAVWLKGEYSLTAHIGYDEFIKLLI